MKALILAAGDGGRFKKRGSKLLEKIYGISLIERTILATKKAGIKDFVIVIGYDGESMRNSIDPYKIGVNIQFIEDSQHEKNGISALRASEILSREKHFLMIMGDHLFDSAILKELLERKRKNEEVALCVDSQPQFYINKESQTKVLADKKGNILAIGKNLHEFNAIDIGIFLCTPAVLRALEKSAKKKNGEVTSAMDFLVKEGKFKAVDIRGKFWININTPEDYQQAKKSLNYQMTKHGLTTEFFNRFLADPLVNLFIFLRFPPALVVLFNGFVGIAAGYFFAIGQNITGASLAQISAILDGVDGRLARITFKESTWGSILDSFFDLLVDFAIFFGIGYYLEIREGHTHFLLYSMIAFVGALILSVPMIVTVPFKKYTISLSKLSRIYSPPKFKIFEKWLTELSMSSKDTRFFYIFLFGLTGQLKLFILIFAIWNSLYAGYRLARAYYSLKKIGGEEEIERALLKVYQGSNP